MDFREQSVIDILMALAEVSNTSIIPDETVGGTASFHFTDADFEESLALFLSNYKMYYKREGNVIRVSRIDVSFDESAGRISMKADSVDVENLIRAMAKAVKISILYDPLPQIALSIDIENLEPKKALEICMLRLPDYALEAGDSYYYIRRTPGQVQRLKPQGEGIVRAGDLYSVSETRCQFQELLPELFKAAGREYSILTKTDTILENLYFAEKDFETMLRIILEQGSADYILHNGIYYIVELQRRDILRKFKETRVVGLRYIPAQELSALLPAEMAAGNIVKTDKNNNALLLTGTAEEIEPIIAFIERIDRPAEGMEYRRFELKYLGVSEAIAAIPQKLVPFAPVPVPKTNAFVATGSPEGLAALKDYLSIIDRKDESYPVELKYIKIDELMKTLPPSVSKEEISDSGYPNLIFFTGPRERQELFLRELALIDRPKPQIRYELLVIEYMKNHETRISRSLSASMTEGSSDSGESLPDFMSYMGNLSNIMNLSFDVVSKFGYQFAANLSVQMGDNTARVYADTTLNGLSGQEIKFQNTDTYRYQEFEVDADTGSITRTGVTREISSGLIVVLNGWVSGDGMITISVNATVSKQNNNGSGDASTIPSTSERIVNTQIRTPSGKPVVLSGLMKEDTNTNQKKIPILGDIPLLGYLFRDKTDTKEKTEIVIYIVPYISRDEKEDQNIPLRLERYYNSFIGGSQ
jgi:type II secretory pathway component GspD/PulD (secretin)